MNSNVRIGLCTLGFFFPILCWGFEFEVPLLGSNLFSDREVSISISAIITTIIFFVTGIELPPSKSIEIENYLSNRSNVGAGSDDKIAKLEKIDALKDKGIIDDDEFKQMKKEILGK